MNIGFCDIGFCDIEMTRDVTLTGQLSSCNFDGAVESCYVDAH